MTTTRVEELPDVRSLVDLVRTGGPEALDAFGPAIDELADTAAVAGFLGIKPGSVMRVRGRTRADGRPDFPPPDRTFGRSPAWRYRTVVLHRAGMPGQGGATKWQPGQSGRTSQPASVAARTPRRRRQPAGGKTQARASRTLTAPASSPSRRKPAGS